MRRQLKRGGQRGLLFWLLFFCLLTVKTFAQPVAPSTSSSPPEKKREPSITLETKESFIPVREEVKILRAERSKQMPYLSKEYIRESIDTSTIEATQAFADKKAKGLNEVVGRAIEVYTPAKAAKERISLAKRRIVKAARELLPGASFNFDLRKGQLSADSFSGHDYHVTFRIPAFRGGILWNSFLREKAEFRAAKKEYDAVLHQVVDEVSTAYFEYNRAEETYKDKEGLVERAQKQQEISKKKFERALISEIESLNVESMAGQMEYDRETAEQELELGKLELQRYLDLDFVEEIDIQPIYNVEELIKRAAAKSETAKAKPEAKRLSGLQKNLDEFIELAYANRPELQVEAQRLRAAQLDEKIARGAFLPRADLTLEFGELAEAFIRNADDPHGQPEWLLTLEVSNNIFGNKLKYTYENDENAPSVTQFQQGTGSQVTRRKMELGLFDGLEEYAELTEAKVKKLEQIIELEKKEQEVIREVKEAYFNYHKAEVQVESSLKRNQYREKLVALAKLRLEKAEIEISEYLQAELDLSEERSRLHRALADLFKAKSNLNRAIGIRDFVPIEERYGL